MGDLSGAQLGDYRVLRRLGRGAMAEVYLAEQTSLGRQVALKVLNADLANDPTYIERFQQEARAAAQLVHASIVQIYEVGRIDGRHFIAQEYVPGRNLGELIARDGRVASRLALDVLRQVAAALHKAAQHGIVHRDIKPENIMLARAGDVKVADFGLARVLGGDRNNLTQVGVTMGTPLYMSPEQVEGRPLDCRSDIYSLGVTAYHMLCGSPPYRGNSPLAVAVQHLNEPPEPLDNRAPDVPAGLARIVHRMMAKKPENRYEDPAALLRDLHSLASEAARQGWGEGPENWSLAEAVALSAGRSEATARLDELMKNTTQVTVGQPSMGRLLLVAASCLLVGVFAAWLLRPRSLIAGTETGTPQLDTPWAQLYHAKSVDTVPAWQAVADFFPDENGYYHRLADEGLVRHFFFRTREFDRAIAPLERLATLGDAQSGQRIFGIAGLAIAYARLDNLPEAERYRQQLTFEMRSRLDDYDPRMAQLLEETDRE